jgi:pimeloyl-ACP methyl ester carboxylesterase
MRVWRVVGFVGAAAALGLASIAVFAVMMTAPPRRNLHFSDGDGFGQLELKTPQGRVSGWFVDGEGRGAVLLLHGVNADRKIMARRLLFLAHAGYSVAAIDLPAHGRSDGEQITFGPNEAKGVAAALDWMRERHPSEKIGIIGVSLGGAAALMAEPPLRVDALALESVFPDIDHAVANRLSAVLGPPGAWIAPVFIAVGAAAAGLKPGVLRPIDRIGDVRAPVFIMSGTADKHTRIEEARAMFARAPEPKRLWEVAGAGHVDLHAFAPEDYEARVLDFLGATLR